MKIPLTTIYSLAAELDSRLRGRKVTAVRDLDPGAGLCLSTDSQNQGTCLALATWPNLFVPFLRAEPATSGSSGTVSQILDRHLRGQIIQSVAPWRHDRIIRLEMVRVDEIRGPIRRALILELVPRRQNIILLDVDRQMVLFSLRRVDQRTSRFRRVLAGEPYQPPPPPPGLHPGDDSAEHFLKAFAEAQGRLLEERLGHLFPWASPYLFGQFLKSIPLDSEAGQVTAEAQRSIWNDLKEWVERLQEGPRAAALIQDEHRRALWLLPYDPEAVSRDRKRLYDTLSQTLEDLFRQQARLADVEAGKRATMRQINLILRRRRRAQKHLRRDLEQAHRAEEFQRAGVILTAHLSRLRKGRSQVSLPDPADPAQEVIISLDPKLTPSENAQRYFQRARKARTTLPQVRRRLRQMEEEIADLTSLREDLARASDQKQLHSIGIRLGRRDAWPPPSSARSPREGAEKRTVGRSFSLPNGWTVLVGRNNKENDRLTHRVARPDDLWFHAQGVPGSHVVLRRGGRKDLPGQPVMELAAGLAAHFSRARHSGTVPVIVAERRYVRKPKGAKPGTAVVEREKTLFVAPLSPERLAEEMK